MNLQLKAAAFFLVDLQEEGSSHEEQLSKLQTAAAEDEDGFAADVEGITVWQPFENETIGGLLERIDELEIIYKEIWSAAFVYKQEQLQNDKIVPERDTFDPNA